MRPPAEPRVATVVWGLEGVVGGVARSRHHPTQSSTGERIRPPRVWYRPRALPLLDTCRITHALLSAWACRPDLALTLERGIGGERPMTSQCCSASDHEAYPTLPRVAQPSSLVTPLRCSDRSSHSLRMGSWVRPRIGAREGHWRRSADRITILLYVRP